MGISDNTDVDMEDDLMGPINITEYRNQVTKGTKDEKYMRILANYVSSIIQESESFLRTEIDLVEDAITLVLDEYGSNFITFELQAGFYTFKDFSEALLMIL